MGNSTCPKKSKQVFIVFVWKRNKQSQLKNIRRRKWMDNTKFIISYLWLWREKESIFITQPTSKKKNLSQFQYCCPQAPCTPCPRTTLIIRVSGNSWFFPQFLSWDEGKMKKAEKKTDTKHMNTKQICCNFGYLLCSLK